jgi:hypothetical protein
MVNIHNTSTFLIYFGMSNEENWPVLPTIFAKIWCLILRSLQNQLFLTLSLSKF